MAALGLDVAFAAGVEILTSSPSVGTLDWRGPLTNVRVTPESTLRSALLACPLCATNRTTTRKLDGNGSGQCAGRPPPRRCGQATTAEGPAYLDKQIQAARKEREQLKRERLVATKIIELAQRGVRVAPTLSAMTLKKFNHY